MIDWIKFSERQPEKEGYYLCYKKDGGMCYDAYVLEWSPQLEGDRKYDWLPCFFDPAITDFESNDCEPDYWAEINLPKEAE